MMGHKAAVNDAAIYEVVSEHTGCFELRLNRRYSWRVSRLVAVQLGVFDAVVQREEERARYPQDGTGVGFNALPSPAVRLAWVLLEFPLHRFIPVQPVLADFQVEV
jgi:hypothetical protein